jgi:hypothetical protein
MKKLVLVAAFLSISTAAFSQDTPTADYARFQGVWYVGGEGSAIIYFIFIDNSVTIMMLDRDNMCFFDPLVTGKYKVEKNTIQISITRELSGTEWTRRPLENGSPTQYMFSDNKLILLSEGGPTALTRIE